MIDEGHMSCWKQIFFNNQSVSCIFNGKCTFVLSAEMSGDDHRIFKAVNEFYEPGF